MITTSFAATSRRRGPRLWSRRARGAEWAWAESLLRAVANLEPSDWVFYNGRTTAGKNLVTNFIAKTTAAGLAPNSQRMRAMWIVGQLQAGVAAVPLMDATDVAPLEAITRYVQFVDEEA